MTLQRSTLALALMAVLSFCSTLLYHLYQSEVSLQQLLPRLTDAAAGSVATWVDIPPSTRPRKTILLYTKLQGSYSSWRRRFGDSFDECRWSRCDITTQRSQLPTADALLLSLYDLSPSERLPPPRSGQIRILYEREAPPALRRRRAPLSAATAASVHWSMSYRRDADIAVPYGVVVPLKQAPPPRNSSRLKVGRSPLTGEPETAEERRQRLAREEEELTRRWRARVGPRVAPVVWVSSHCRTHSSRETYVQQLRQSIDVDVYGDCGELSCPINRKGFCLRLFQQHYSFMLAFENAMCVDYVTEKFFNALRYGMIPVVLGGANYSRVAPPGSFIDALDYNSPRHLAEELLRLHRSPDELSRFHAWRHHYRVYSGEREFTWWKCELCRRLHQRRVRVRNRDVRELLMGGEQCQGTWQRALALRHGETPDGEGDEEY